MIFPKKLEKFQIQNFFLGKKMIFYPELFFRNFVKNYYLETLDNDGNTNSNGKIFDFNNM